MGIWIAYRMNIAICHQGTLDGVIKFLNQMSTGVDTSGLGPVLLIAAGSCVLIVGAILAVKAWSQMSNTQPFNSHVGVSIHFNNIELDILHTDQLPSQPLPVYQPAYHRQRSSENDFT